MRVLVLTDEVPSPASPSSAAASLHALLLQLRRRGHSLTVATGAAVGVAPSDLAQPWPVHHAEDLRSAGRQALDRFGADVAIVVDRRLQPIDFSPSGAAPAIVHYEATAEPDARASTAATSGLLFAAGSVQLMQHYRQRTGIGGLVVPPRPPGERAVGTAPRPVKRVDRFEALLIAARPGLAPARGRLVDLERRPRKAPAVTRSDIGWMEHLQKQIAAIANATDRDLPDLARRFANPADRPTATAMAQAVGLPLTPHAAQLARAAAVHRQECILQCLKAYAPGGWRPAIVMVGRQHVERALAQGRGAIVWAIHTAFASNIVKMAMHAASWRLSQVSRPEHGLSDSEFGMACLNRVRTDFENRFLVQRIRIDRSRPASAMIAARRSLTRNELVAFTAGDFEGARAVEQPFPGGVLRLATGPIRLALLSGAPVLPVAAVRRADGAFVVRVEPPLDLGAGKSEEDRLIAGSAQLGGHIMRIMIRHPDQLRGWTSLGA